MAVDERDDFLIDLSAEHHFHHIDHFLIGDTLPVDEFGLDSE